MRRWLAFALLMLWLGTVTTVAVAWLYASISHPALGRNRLSWWSGSSYGFVNGWKVKEMFGPGKSSRVLEPIARDENDPYDRNVDLPSWSIGTRTARDDDRMRFEDARGWPFLSLRCTWSEQAHPYVLPDEMLSGGIPITAFEPESIVDYLKGVYYTSIDPDYIYIEEHRALPLIPIWSGLAGSVLFWGSAWTLMVFVLSMPGVLVRFRRRRRQRCVRCAYVLLHLDSARCPECGWEIGKRLPALTRGRMSIALALALVMTLATGALGFAAARRFNGPGAIHAAARHNDVDQLRRLLADGASVDLQVSAGMFDWFYSLEGTTPLMWAAAHGNVEAIRVLLNAGADAGRTVGWSGQSALGEAALRGHTEAVRLLIAAGSDLVGAQQPILASAALSGSEACVRALLEAGAPVNPPQVSGWETTPLCAAAEAGQTEIARLLLDAGADINPKLRVDGVESVSGPLFRAVSAGRTETVRLLLERGADVSPAAGILLWEAADKDQTEIARMLMAAGADPNQEHPVANGWTPFQRSILRGNLELARMLVAAGANPLTINQAGESVLFAVFHADKSDPHEAVQYLIGLGLDINFRSTVGNTALVEAVYFQREPLVRALLDAGADPLTRNNFGNSALDYSDRELDLPSHSIRWEAGHDAKDETIRQLVGDAAARRKPGP